MERSNFKSCFLLGHSKPERSTVQCKQADLTLLRRTESDIFLNGVLDGKLDDCYGMETGPSDVHSTLGSPKSVNMSMGPSINDVGNREGGRGQKLVKIADG